MIYNWSKYRRKQNNLDKSEYNYMVNEAITKHYRYLHSRLVKVDDDEATFNDAYLMLTRKYNPEQDFIDQFIKAFNQLKGEYQRDDKCYNYAETKVEYYTDYINTLCSNENTAVHNTYGNHNPLNFRLTKLKTSCIVSELDALKQYPDAIKKIAM